MVEYSLIAAVPDNWVIGNGLKIPWYIPEDFKLFKERTTDSVVIMGYNTWISLPEKFRPLSNRVNIVLNKERRDLGEGVYCANSFEDAFSEAERYDKEIFIMGGASVYAQTISDATYLYISHVHGEFEGDIFFPKFDLNDYEVVEEIPFEKFTFKKYKRK